MIWAILTAIFAPVLVGGLCGLVRGWVYALSFRRYQRSDDCPRWIKEF